MAAPPSLVSSWRWIAAFLLLLVLEGGVELDHWAELTTGFNLSDLENLLDSAGDEAGPALTDPRPVPALATVAPAPRVHPPTRVNTRGVELSCRHLDYLHILQTRHVSGSGTRG